MWLLWAVLLLALSYSALASEVLVVTGSWDNAAALKNVHMAAQFYGIDERVTSTSEFRRALGRSNKLTRPEIVALVVTSEALGELDHRVVLRATRRADGSQIPLLLLVTSPQENSAGLSSWSGGSVEGCSVLMDGRNGWKLTFGQEPTIARQLAGMTLMAGAPACGLVLAHASNAQVVASANDGTHQTPVFLQVGVESQAVFILADMLPAVPAGTLAGRLESDFVRFSGLMMFLRQAAGETAWHMPGNYANLTIDDPWLTEPYGNLRYRGLLEQMEQHKFHTTIAFVPWNYDRSQAEVVDLFKEHPEQLSISIHGNNHNHQEFNQYSSRPLSRQREDIRQAVGRMNAFSKATGLSYDRVMVFPHAVAPADTFALLKEYNYSATVNSDNVPLGSQVPADPLFNLRPWTLQFKSFPSIKRVSAEVPVSGVQTAINAFLGNPQLFYIHQDFFQAGIDAFNGTADEVNHLEPDVQWKSLGYIAQHLYLIRVRPDHDYDVLASTSNFKLENPTLRRVVYHVYKPDDMAFPAGSVTLDQAPMPYKANSDAISFDVVLEPNQSRNVEISYDNDLGTSAVDITKSSPLVAADRGLSDFRDMWLSRTAFGRGIERGFYKFRLNRLEELIERWGTLILLLLAAWIAATIVASCVRQAKRGARKHQPVKSTS